MTANEALQEMRADEVLENDLRRRNILAWADAIEAELKAKDVEIERLRAEVKEWQNEAEGRGRHDWPSSGERGRPV